MLGLNTFARKVFGSTNDRKVKPLLATVERINALEPELERLSDEDLRGRTGAFKQRLGSGETLDALLPEAFATVREAARRTLGQRHYDVQMMGGMVLHSGKISEMKTGEGKTLVATLPVYLNALTGKGVHVVTVNDYLARRDADWMGEIYRFLGLEVGCIVPGIDDMARQRAYAADVTYATNNELGFDYLRDNLKHSVETMAQRGHHFAIVDEVDSILIDEARTPLIISGPTEDFSELYRTVDEIVKTLEDNHYEIDEKTRSAVLTDEGNEVCEQKLEAASLLRAPSLYDLENVSLVHHINQALKAHRIFRKDRDYIVKQDKVVIIDEFTGRAMEGRRYSEGLHQALEAKEHVEIQAENQTLASITFQNYFRLYDKLAGMTGTALTEAAEFGETYGLDVLEIPTNVAVARADEDDEVYRTAKEKYDAIVMEIADAHRRQQPVLVGTTSIEKSEIISNLLSDKTRIAELGKTLIEIAEGIKSGKEQERRTYLMEIGTYLQDRAEQANGKRAPIPHHVLNARFHEQEAYIVAQAGRPAAVTIATNMAGRGTDIQLGGNAEMRVIEETAGAENEAKAAEIREHVLAEVAEEKRVALEAGGLYVIGTERHESRRIDNQLRGRSGRQGDPGRSKFFLSLQDDLMRIFGSERMDSMLVKLGLQEGEAIIHPWINRAVEKAQSKVEARNFDARKHILKYDNVMNDQRKVIFEQRRQIMQANDVSETVQDMRQTLVEDLIDEHLPERALPDQWDTAGLKEELDRILGVDLPIPDWAAEEGIANEQIKDRVLKAADTRAAERAVKFGAQITRQIEKAVLLQTIDHHWREHLLQLEHLSKVIGFRGYGQRDPLNEYKTEAFTLFEGLLGRLRRDVTIQLMNIQVQLTPSAGALSEEEVEELVPGGDEPDPESLRPIHQDPTTGESEATTAAQPAAGQPARNGGVAVMSRDDPSTWGKVGRNEPCPCGSGKKYKHCHGAI